MTQVSDVLDLLMNYADIEGYSSEQLLPSCERGLQWVKERLRSGVAAQDFLVCSTAAALAHYFFFLCRMSEPDKYETYTAGDMTVRRNIEKEFLYETEIKNQAIAAASTILEDGGFYFGGV